MARWQATAGALSALGLGMLGAAFVAPHVPSGWAAGPLARMLDSLALHLAVLTLGPALVLWGLGHGRKGLGLGALACLAGLATWLPHRATSLPPTGSAAEGTVRVLFFNVFKENSANARAIAGAARATGADVMVFAEAQAMYDALPLIAEEHEVLTPCYPTHCPLLIASRLPARRTWQLSLNPVWTDRYGVSELEGPGGQAFFLSVAHMVKPWFSGVAEVEWGRLMAQVDWLPGPALVVGDFNAAPWSRPMATLLTETGFTGVRLPPATWPARAGGIGVPIDQALVGGGARIASVTAFGGDLGSNHRGLVVDLVLPEAD